MSAQLASAVKGSTVPGFPPPGTQLPWCDHCGWYFHSTEQHGTPAHYANQKPYNPNTPFNPLTQICAGCGKIGHHWSECPTPDDDRVVLQLLINQNKSSVRESNTNRNDNRMHHLFVARTSALQKSTEPTLTKTRPTAYVCEEGAGKNNIIEGSPYGSRAPVVV